MLPLPPVAPTTGWRASMRLPRDHYVRLDGNDYSVHPAVIGRRVEVVADLDRVRVLCEGRLVADHDRSWARHQVFTDPLHAAAATALRRDHRALTAAPRPQEPQVQLRALSDYDAITDPPADAGGDRDVDGGDLDGGDLDGGDLDGGDLDGGDLDGGTADGGVA
jgi:hypothetical protein